MLKFTIPLNPTTKKNSQQLIVRKGRPIAIPSAQYRKYEKDCMLYLIGIVTEPISARVNVKAVYYIETRRRIDLTNLHEALHDALVKAKVLEDDNCNIIVSTDGSYVDYDKENPRTEVEITFLEEKDGKK